MKLPLYYQIYSNLRARIDSGEYPPGSMLPTEQELLKTFNASRAPVRQALGLLKSEGVVKRYPGKGTFVAGPPEGLHLWSNFSPLRKVLSPDSEAVRNKALTVEMRSPPEAVRDFLLFGGRGKTAYLERIRYIGERPALFCQHYVQPYLELKAFKKLGESFCLRAVLRDHCLVEITRMEDSLRAVPAPAEIAAHLGVDASSPVLLTERRSYMQDAPVQFDFFYMRTDIWDYTVAFEKDANGATSAFSMHGAPRRAGVC